MNAGPLGSPQPAVVLSVHEARKRFAGLDALDGVSLSLREGELVGLLGPNGAGKTTLIRAITGRVRLDGGGIELFGRPARDSEDRGALGVVPQDLAVYPLLTARENLAVFAEIHGVKAAERKERVVSALQLAGLADRADQPVRDFSGGMKRRLNFACGILHHPRLVLLDEPTVGVDPQSRERVYEMLTGLRAEGVAILLATHQLEEAETRCERIIVIDHGRVAASGTLKELLDQTVGTRRLVTMTVDHLPGVLPPGVSAVKGGGLRAEVQDVAAELPSLLRRLEEAGGKVGDFEVRSPGLHAVFLQLTGRELRE